ncbi:MAG: hypothetical protein L6290_05715 [Thermodesulfovibrionales bacterium]|nr:hypothetical protein [Thermodesulfovibrionales bacterium]
MKRIVFFVILLLLIPFAAQAEYTFFLKNGSEISAVQTYAEQGDEVTVYFSAGSMIISRQDILRIEGSEAIEEGIAGEAQPPDTQKTKEKKDETAGQAQRSGEMNERKGALNNELDSLRTEIRAVEKQEMDLVTTINEKIGSDKSYNIIQRRQLEKEIEPLKKELSDVQNKKTELLQRRFTLEEQLRLVQ